MATEDSDKQNQRNLEVESRLTKAEAILPTLATKGDLKELGSKNEAEMQKLGSRLVGEMAEIRVEMHKMDASIKTWTLATVLTIIGTLLAALFGFNQINKNAAPLAAQPPVIINLPGVSNPPAVAPR